MALVCEKRGGASTLGVPPAGGVRRLGVFVMCIAFKSYIGAFPSQVEVHFVTENLGNGFRFICDEKTWNWL